LNLVKNQGVKKLFLSINGCDNEISYLQNSFNVASEGVVFADESYISDIAPYRELLENESFEQVSISHICNSFIRVKREDITGKNFKS
jgi:hypothetical protein